MRYSRRCNHAERFQLQLPGVHSLRVHRSTARDRRTDGDRAKPVSDGSVSAGDVSVLWTEAGSAESAVLGGGWLCAAVQTAGNRQLSMAEDKERGSSSDITTVPMADGRTEYRAAEGAQASDRAEHDIIAKTVEMLDFHAFL